MLGIFPEIVEMLPATRDERNFVRTIEDVGKRISIPGEVALSEPCQRGAVLLVDPCQRPRPFDLLEPKIGIIIRRGDGGSGVNGHDGGVSLTSRNLPSMT